MVRKTDIKRELEALINRVNQRYSNVFTDIKECTKLIEEIEATTDFKRYDKAIKEGRYKEAHQILEKQPMELKEFYQDLQHLNALIQPME